MNRLEQQALAAIPRIALLLERIADATERIAERLEPIPAEDDDLDALPIGDIRRDQGMRTARHR